MNVNQKIKLSVFDIMNGNNEEAGHTHNALIDNNGS